MNKKHELLREYTKMLVEGRTNALIVKGARGLGKSHTIMDTLDELGFQEDVHYIYVTGYITPLQLYNLLSKNVALQDPKLYVFDDLDSIVANKTCVSLLKSALWEVRGKRVVSYQSTSNKVEVPSFEFEGRVLLVLNTLREESLFSQALLDRSVYYDMRLSHKELIQHIEEIVPEMHKDLSLTDRQDVWAKIKIFSGNKNFSVRCVSRAFEFFKYDKHNWLNMFLNTLNMTDDERQFHEEKEQQRAVVRQLQEVDAPEYDKIKEFERLTQRDERTYYRIKKTL